MSHQEEITLKSAPMFLYQAVTKFMEPYSSIESAEQEIDAIGAVLQVLKKMPYASQKRLLEYAGHWVENENHFKEKRNAEIKIIATSQNSGRKQGGSANRDNKYSHSQVSRLGRSLKKWAAKRKSDRAAAKRFNKLGDSGHRENPESVTAPQGISEITPA